MAGGSQRSPRLSPLELRPRGVVDSAAISASSLLPPTAITGHLTALLNWQHSLCGITPPSLLINKDFFFFFFFSRHLDRPLEEVYQIKGSRWWRRPAFCLPLEQCRPTSLGELLMHGHSVNASFPSGVGLRHGWWLIKRSLLEGKEGFAR